MVTALEPSIEAGRVSKRTTCSCIICNSAAERSALVATMKMQKIVPVFHYQSLHKSPYFNDKHDGRTLEYADYYSDRLLRLPMYFQLSESDVNRVAESIHSFYKST